MTGIEHIEGVEHIEDHGEHRWRIMGFEVVLRSRGKQRVDVFEPQQSGIDIDVDTVAETIAVQDTRCDYPAYAFVPMPVMEVIVHAMRMAKEQT